MLRTHLYGLILILLCTSSRLIGRDVDTASVEERVYELYVQVREDPLKTRSEVFYLLRKFPDVDLELKYGLYEVLGDSYYMVSQYDSAVHYFLYARDLMEQAGDSASLAYNSTYLGETYVEMGLHSEAARHFFLAREYYQRIGDPLGEIDALYGLSLLFFDRGENDEALNLAFEAVALVPEEDAEIHLPSLYNQIATLYALQGRADTAEYLARLSLEMNSKGDQSLIERLYGMEALAKTLIVQSEFEEARAYIDSSMQMAADIKDYYAEIYLLSDEAEWYHAKGDLSKAWDRIASAAKISRQKGAVAALRFTYKTAVTLAMAEEEYLKALHYRDSLSLINTDFLNSNFQVVLLEQELQEARSKSNELEREKKIGELLNERNTALLIMALLAGVGAGIAWFFQYKANQRIRRFNAVLEERNKMISAQNTQLDEQTKVLTENQKLLKRSNADKDKLLTLISHDLRSPIAQVKSVSELVIQGAIREDEMEGFFKKISANADKSLENLTDVLVWARSQMDNGMKSTSTVVNAREAVEGAYNLVESNYQDKELTLQIISTSESPNVYCDKSHLGIILRNLLSNAAKFSYRGGKVQVKIRHDEGWVHFEVEDQGTGMSDEVLAKIMEGSELVSGSGTEKETGTGTGLQLVREFTEANGGKLDINSVLNQGTNILVSFRKA